MHERMLDKKNIPNENEINEHIGKKSYEYIQSIKGALEKVLEINMELRFPYGNDYGWGYKFSSKSKHLFDLFFEKNSISVLMSISKIKTEKELEKYNRLSGEGKNHWENRYPCEIGRAHV